MLKIWFRQVTIKVSGITQGKPRRLCRIVSTQEPNFSHNKANNRSDRPLLRLSYDYLVRKI